MASTTGADRVRPFRRMLLEVLTDNPGSVEVEKAYLETYREWLEALVQGPPEPIATTAEKSRRRLLAASGSGVPRPNGPVAAWPAWNLPALA